MTDEVDRRLSAALRAQASGLGTGSPAASAPGDHKAYPAPVRARLRAWVVLALAVLLGAMAGGLAGVISVW